MTSGTIDQIKNGHVLRYVDLFKSEAAARRDEGAQERPVVALHVEHDTQRVFVLPVTTKGGGKTGTIPLPAQAASACGLAPQSSILITEYSHFKWLGFDIRPVGESYITGRLPPGFTAKIRAPAASARGIDRD